MTTKPKKVETWMPILVDKYLGDTTHLTTEQHGAYLLLLLTCWKRDGKLPADDAQLATIARLPMAKWRAAKAILLVPFQHDGDFLVFGEGANRITSRPLFGYRKHLPAVLERCGRKCWYCGCGGIEFELDHVFPRSRGGGDDPENLVPSCGPCNRSKGARTPDEWRMAS